MPFSRIGKKQTRKTTITLGVVPNPNQVTNSGAKAIFGTISSVTASG